MSARYRPVSWTPAKRVYDAALVAGIVLYLVDYMELAPWLGGGVAVDERTMVLRVYSTIDPLGSIVL